MALLELREKPPTNTTKILYLLVTLALTFSIIAILISLTGANPLIAYQELFTAPFRNVHNITEILVTMTPLLLIALGLSLSFKCKFWNIGAEGQFYAGALMCTATVLVLKGSGMPFVLFIPLLMVVGFLGGALWAIIAAVLKIKFQINEIIVTLLLNFIMVYFLSFLLYGPWMDPVSVMPQSALFPLSARIPKLILETRLHMGLFIAILAIPSVYLILNRTVLGYQTRAIGGSSKAARFGGIKVSRVLLFVVIISGGMAGLAGMGEVSGVFYRLRGDISPGYGYTAILVALLGKNHPGWVTLVAFLFAALLVGGYEMQTATGIPSALALVAQGLIFFGVLSAEALSRYKIKLRG